MSAASASMEVPTTSSWYYAWMDDRSREGFCDVRTKPDRGSVHVRYNSRVVSMFNPLGMINRTLQIRIVRYISVGHVIERLTRYIDFQVVCQGANWHEIHHHDDNDKHVSSSSSLLHELPRGVCICAPIWLDLSWRTHDFWICPTLHWQFNHWKNVHPSQVDELNTAVSQLLGVVSSLASHGDQIRPQWRIRDAADTTRESSSSSSRDDLRT